MKEVSSIWFTRPSSSDIKDLIATYPELNLPKDNSSEIIRYQNLKEKEINYIQGKNYLSLLKLLNSEKGLEYEPSSGFCIIFQVINHPKFFNYEKYLIGFTWEGWHGHNWKFEREYCLNLANKGELIII